MIKKLFIILGTIGTYYGAEVSDPKTDMDKPSVAKKLIVSHPTCLCPQSGGYSKKEMLQIRRNCLNTFMDDFWTEISTLSDAGFFEGKINKYDENIMNLLNRIVKNEGRHNWNNITIAFEGTPQDFFRDIKDLADLIEARHTETDSEIVSLLEEMREPLIVVKWVTIYYWNNRMIYKLSLNR